MSAAGRIKQSRIYHFWNGSGNAKAGGNWEGGLMAPRAWESRFKNRGIQRMWGRSDMSCFWDHCNNWSMQALMIICREMPELLGGYLPFPIKSITLPYFSNKYSLHFFYLLFFKKYFLLFIILKNKKIFIIFFYFLLSL